MAIQTLEELKNYLKGLQFSFEGDVSGRYSYDDLDKIPLFPNQYMYVSSIRSLSIDYKRNVEKVLGYSDAQFSPMKLYGSVHPDQMAMVMEATRLSFEYAFAFELFSYEYSFSTDFKTKHADGHYITILRQSSFFEFDQNQVPTSIMSICTDISSHKEGESVGWQLYGFEDNLIDLSHVLNRLVNQDVSCLSEREIEVIRLLAEGKSSKEIALELFISMHTVDTHRRKILKKLELKNVVELVMFALKSGILKS